MIDLKELAFADLASELAATRRVLERVPDERLSWKPHEKSTSLGELAAHVVDIVGWQVAVLREDGIDFATAPPPSVTPESGRVLLDGFEERAAALRSAVEAMDEPSLSRDWTLRVGERILFTRPKLVVFRSFGQCHLAHHRGQLTVYLRLLEIPLPPVYGPTADEP